MGTKDTVCVCLSVALDRVEMRLCLLYCITVCEWGCAAVFEMNETLSVYSENVLNTMCNSVNNAPSYTLDIITSRVKQGMRHLSYL